MHNVYVSSFLEERKSLLSFTHLAPDGKVELSWKGQQLCCTSESSSTPLLQRHN